MKSVARWIIVSLVAFGLFPLSIAASANPVASSLSPSAGSKLGSSALIVSGTGFLDISNSSTVTAVELSVSGQITSLSFTVSSATRISTVIPSRGAGASTGSADILVRVSGVANPFSFPYTFLNSFVSESNVVSAPAVGSFSAVLTGYSFSGLVSSAFISTSTAVTPATFTATSDTQLTLGVPVLAASSRSAKAFLGVTFTDNTTSVVPINLVGPTVSSTVPSSGTAAGGNSVTISGQGFLDANNAPAVTKIMFGSDLVTSSNFTVVNATTITVSLPVRTGNSKTVGANRVAVFFADDISSSQTVFYYFTPVRDELKDNNGLVMLGELASRSNRKPIFRTATPPYIVTGTDSLTGEQYQYETNWNYISQASNASQAYKREGHQPGFTKRLENGSLQTIAAPTLRAGSTSISAKAAGTVFPYVQRVNNLNVNKSVTMPQDSVVLSSVGDCPNLNDFDSGDGQGNTTSFCTVFGPEIYSETFYGKRGQSLGFNWFAIGQDDDYSVYGYLVAVQGEANIPSSDTSAHTLVAHGVGNRERDGFWTSAVADIPADGLYRFRFVNGSYDGTGGWVVGSTFAISNVYEAGLTNRINFGPISDQLTGGTFTAPASATSGGAISVSSRTTASCTVATSHTGTTTTVTITKVAVGTCILVASRGLDGEFAPAADRLVAFDILSVQTSASAPVITQVTAGDQSLNVRFALPSRDGGYPVTSYEYSTDGGNTWSSASPASTASSMVITQSSGVSPTPLVNGVTYSIVIRALTNPSVPPGARSNTALGTPNAPALAVINYNPSIVTRTVGVPTSILAPTNTGGLAGTYAIASGSLPPGLTLNAVTGIIGGSPTATGNYTVTVTRTNSTGTSAPATLQIIVNAVAANPPALTWSPNTGLLYTAYVGTAFTADAPVNSNSADSAVFTIAPALPGGFTINSTTGVVSGTGTTTSPSTSYVITATNGAGTSTVSFTLLVLPALPSGGGGGSGGGVASAVWPLITLITPNVVTTAGGQTIRVDGLWLGAGSHVIVGGQRANLVTSSATSFTFVMPAVSAGKRDLQYFYNGGAQLTYLNAITVNAVAPEPTKSPEVGGGPVVDSPPTSVKPRPWRALGIASKFAPGSPEINRAVRAQVNEMLRLYGSRATTIQCTGFTMGPSVLRVDAKLSLDRAQAVCRLIKQLRPRLTVISATGRQELRLGGEVRRVEVLFQAR